MTGADKVFATCGTDEKVAFLQKLTNNDSRLHVINYKTQSQSGLPLTAPISHQAWR